MKFISILSLLIPFGLSTFYHQLFSFNYFLFIIFYTIPILLSHKAIDLYQGYDAQQNHIKITLQRLILITLTQSLPLAFTTTWCPISFCLWVVVFIVILAVMRIKIKNIIYNFANKKAPQNNAYSHYKPTLGLYHPHAHQRAGGEMVLWRLVHALNSSDVPLDITILSNTVPEELLQLKSKGINHNKTPSTLSGHKFELSDSISSELFLEYTKSLSESTTALTLPKSPLINTIDLTASPTLNTSHISAIPPIAPIAPKAPINPVEIPEIILEQVKDTFGIDLLDANPLSTNLTKHKNQTINQTNSHSEQNLASNHNLLFFEFLSHTELSDSGNYPRLTLLLQTINSIYPLFYHMFSLIFFPQWFAGKETTFPIFLLDTSGYPICSLLCKLIGIPCGSYVHYPIIQHDMITRNLLGLSTLYNSQRNQTTSTSNIIELNNINMIRSNLKSCLKWIKHYYFSILCIFYSELLSLNTFLLANGTWTFNHLSSLLGPKSTPIIPTPQQFPTQIKLEQPSLITNPLTIPLIGTDLSNFIKAKSINTTFLGRLFPPCNISPPTSKLQSNQNYSCSVSDKVSKLFPIFISLGQYRPEKQQLLILDAFITLLQNRLNDNEPLFYRNFPISLFFIGTYRPNDLNLIQEIITKIETTIITKSNQSITSLDPQHLPQSQQPPQIRLSNHVKCFFNAPLSDLSFISKISLAGLHAMVDEHFGIAVVELLSNCYTIIGHKSAGPYLDIIVPAKEPKLKNSISDKNINDTAQIVNGSKCVGYVASTPIEYSTMMEDILTLYGADIVHSQSCTRLGNHCGYNSILYDMSIEGQNRAYDQFSLKVFDQNVHSVVIPLIMPFLPQNAHKID
jgi:glycosyltransferase involved in cell wall biosynthesis